MKKTIRFGDKEVECVCNALTPFLYTEMFNKDFLTNMTSFMKFQNKKASDYTAEDLAFVSKRTNMFAEIAFVFAKQGEESDVSKLVNLSKTDFYSWLSGISDARAFSQGETLKDLIDLWLGNTETTTESKNA